MPMAFEWRFRSLEITITIVDANAIHNTRCITGLHKSFRGQSQIATYSINAIDFKTCCVV